MLLERKSEFQATPTQASVRSIVQTLQNRVLAESLRNSVTQRYWTIHGSGSIGEKAQDLLVKNPEILASGFGMNEREVLAMGWFLGFYSRNSVVGDPKKKMSRIMLGEFSREETETLARILEKFKGNHIFVRSSAHGDARGTGVYESKLVIEPNLEKLKDAIRKVLASQFSKGAVAFREQAGLPEGMAIMIEPADGKEMIIKYEWGDEETAFAPNFSGFGYTDTSWGEGYIKLVGGFPFKAVGEGKGIKITERDVEKEEELFGLIRWMMLEQSRGVKIYASSNSDLLLNRGEAVGSRRITEFDTTKGCSPVHLKPFFEGIARLQELCGKPQYFEWSGVKRGKKFEITILQIADFSPKIDFFEFPKNPENVVATARYVRGTNRVRCNSLVHVISEKGTGELAEYNRTHQNYAVFYGSRLILSKQLKFEDLSNASVLFEFQNTTGRMGDPAEHFMGRLDLTRKIFLVNDWVDFEQLEQKAKIQPGYDGLIVFEAPILVTASERQQKAIVELIPE